MAVSVPKRLYKRAVDRNLLKRRIREAYRLNKQEFYFSLLNHDRKAEVVIQYRASEIAGFDIIENSLREAMQKAITRIGKEVTE